MPSFACFRWLFLRTPRTLKLLNQVRPRINQAIQIFLVMQAMLRNLVWKQVTRLLCLHHLGRWSTPSYASTDVPSHLISVLPVRSGKSKQNR